MRALSAVPSAAFVGCEVLLGWCRPTAPFLREGSPIPVQCPVVVFWRSLRYVVVTSLVAVSMADNVGTSPSFSKNAVRLVCRGFGEDLIMQHCRAQHLYFAGLRMLDQGPDKRREAQKDEQRREKRGSWSVQGNFSKRESIIICV